MTTHDEVLQQFLLEGRELVERAGNDLSALLRVPSDPAALAGLFRSLHTLKGSAGFVDLPILEAMFHAAETRLDLARRSGRLDEADGARLARVLDTTEAWLDALEAGQEPSEKLSRTTAELTTDWEDSAAALEDLAPPPLGVEAAGAAGPLVSIRYAPDADAYFKGDDPLAIIRTVPGLMRLHIAAASVSSADTYDPFRCTLRLDAVSSAPIADVRAALRLVSDQVELEVFETALDRAPVGTPLALRSVRVDADRLDDVATLVDQLVVAKNALLFEAAQLAAVTSDTGGSRALANSQAAMERIVADLHDAVAELRLVPLAQLFGRFPRPVREMAHGVGKEVEFLTGGGHVSLDKSVVEGLFEPILHLLRNAIDHGIEPVDVRQALDKRPRALVTVTAQARGDSVTIDIADDGRGIDLAKVRRTALERGVVSDDAVDALADEAALALVFAPGFSTAQDVGQLSGRGVGMDAVRAGMTQLGGRVTLDNRPGQGLTARLTLPAQVVLTQILVVRSAGETFGVPLDSVAETHRVRPQEVTQIRAGRAFLRRQDVIPILRLSDLLGATAPPEDAVFPVLAVEAGGHRVGIQVDEVGERIEAPLRPLQGLMASIPGVLGTVLQGDGRVLLVLDLQELAA